MFHIDSISLDLLTEVLTEDLKRRKWLEVARQSKTHQYTNKAFAVRLMEIFCTTKARYHDTHPIINEI